MSITSYYGFKTFPITTMAKRLPCLEPWKLRKHIQVCIHLNCERPIPAYAIPGVLREATTCITSVDVIFDILRPSSRVINLAWWCVAETTGNYACCTYCIWPIYYRLCKKGISVATVQLNYWRWMNCPRVGLLSKLIIILYNHSQYAIQRHFTDTLCW